MSSSTYPIKGIPLSSQTLPLRQEITAWEKDQKNKYQVSLFLRALAAVQAKPVEEQLGFFQIAGSFDAIPERAPCKLIEQEFTGHLWWTGMV